MAASSHAIFNRDPAEWVAMVHTSVKLKTNNGESYKGYVYTIDPVSQSVVLVELTNDPIQVSSLKVIFGHAVESITPDDDLKSLTVEEKEYLEKLFKPKEVVHNQENLLKDREKLRNWLCENKIPVTVTIDYDGAECLNISDALLIRPPYTPDDCQSGNVIMLSKVQTLIANMPR